MGMYTRPTAPVGNPRTVNPAAGVQRPGLNVPRPDLGPGVIMGGGPAPIQRPGVGPGPRPIIGPAPKPLPQLPYGGPIGMPGGQLPPNVNVGFGMPPPTQAGTQTPGMQVPVNGLPTNGMGGGKSMPGDMSGQMPSAPGMPNMGMPNMGMPNMGMPGGPQIGYGFDPNTGGPLGPQSQPMPNFANVLGTASPLFNTLQR